MSKLVECVPNFSEGRDRRVIDAIAGEIAGTDGVRLLDVDPGADTNRTVYTFVGSPEAVIQGALAGARAAASLIDMSRHKGTHPRIGALDVCPIVPISNVTMSECVEIARTIGSRLADELRIPIYFYEHAATQPERQDLAAVRAGEYEGLPRKLADPMWAPDRGPAAFNARLGATAVGARGVLIAYNVNLNTRDKRLAQEIALNIRESGRKRDGISVPGRLKAVRAIGWYIEQYRQAQVSVNLVDFRTTPLHRVFEAVREEAERLGLLVTGSELIGMIPAEPLLEAGRFYLRRQQRSTGVPEREVIEMAIRSLGLDQLAPFDPEKKVIEYAVQGPMPLLSLSVDRFLDEVSSASPVPGGGSVAALAGSLAAALAAMVANLTVAKDPSVADELSALAERAQAVKRALAIASDEDARAFDRVLEARRQPRATPEERAARGAAIEPALKRAADVPLETARLSLEALELAGVTASKGIKAAVSDALVAAVLARAAVDAALLNVRTNLESVHDAEFARAGLAEADRLSARAEQAYSEIVRKVVV